MIELLGIGIQRPDGSWLLRRLSARLDVGELVLVTSVDRDVRVAVLDTIAARRVPTEGRAWVAGLPVRDTSVRSVRARVGDVDMHGRLSENRSVLSNVTAAAPERRPRLPWLKWPAEPPSDRALAALRSVGLERRVADAVAALDAWSRQRLLLARALVTRPPILVAREVDDRSSPSAAAGLLGLMRALAELERLTVVATVSSEVLVQTFAHRVLAVEHASLAAGTLASAASVA